MSVLNTSRVHILVLWCLTSRGKGNISLSRIQVFCLPTFKTRREMVTHADDGANSSYQPAHGLKFERSVNHPTPQACVLTCPWHSCDLSTQGHLSFTPLLSPLTCSQTGDLHPESPLILITLACGSRSKPDVGSC